MAGTKRSIATLGDSTTRENPQGIHRTTLAYNEASMLCHFRLQTGAMIPLHAHAAVQVGYLISGKVRFKFADGSQFVAEPGTSYVFDPHQRHGAEVLEDSEVIEVFSPMRPEYADAH